MHVKVSSLSIMTRDISKFQKNETCFETYQEVLGMRNVFQGTIIKIWKGNNFETREDRKCNKIIVKESVFFLQLVQGR